MDDYLKYLLTPTNIALLLGGILTSFFGFKAAISDAEKIPKWITRGSLIAGLVVIGAGFLSSYQDQQSAAALQAKTDQIAKASQINTELALKNSELNKKIADSITGGNSYCYLSISKTNKPNVVDLMLQSEGEYPVYGVEIQIHDINQRIENLQNARKKDTNSNMSMSGFLNFINKSALIKNMGDIPPNTAYPLGTLQLPNDAIIANYHIFIYALNGRVTQLVQFRKINEKWITAEKIFFKNKVVRKHVPQGFPKDDDSKFILND